MKENNTKKGIHKELGKRENMEETMEEKNITN
jgi:hypothetical protein